MSDYLPDGATLPPAPSETFPPLIPGIWLDEMRADMNRQLDSEFLFGDGSPVAPLSRAPLRDRLRWRFWIKPRGNLRLWRARTVRCLWRDPRERLARRIAPWLIDDDEARQRYY